MYENLGGQAVAAGYVNELRYDQAKVRREEGAADLSTGDSRAFEAVQNYGANSANQLSVWSEPGRTTLYQHWGEVDDQEHVLSLYLVRFVPRRFESRQREFQVARVCLRVLENF